MRRKNKDVYLKSFCRVLLLVFTLGTYPLSFATTIPDALKNLVPASTNPSIAGSAANPRHLPAPHLAPSVTPPAESNNKLGPEAERIKFKLTKINLSGNHVYTEKQLLPIYQSKLNTEISIAELENLVQDITNYYRNNGYILSRAILPPQHVEHGVVQVKVIEGYIGKVSVVGKARGAKHILEAYGERISQSRPLQVKVLERYLYLANGLPGVSVRAVLQPSATEVGAADLELVTNTTPVSATVTYDNQGTLYIGPLEVSGSVAANSMLRAGDSTRFLYLESTHGNNLRYGDLSYDTPFGSSGLDFNLDWNISSTVPGFELQPYDTNGGAQTYVATLVYPIIRAREQNFSVNSSFTYINSITNLDGAILYDDRVRPLQVGLNYSFTDRYEGWNVIAAQIIEGLNVMDASNDPNSLTTSRFGADGVFTKWNVQAGHDQPLFGRFSLYGFAQGQYSYNPLLVSQQFGFGGAIIGRGYDPAEIIGDRGASGSLELRMDTYPTKYLLQSMQFYTFYDAGVIWNLRDLPNSNTKQSATSTGIGARFSIMNHVTGNLYIAQPLTKSIAAEALIGRGRCPRTFFSLVATT